MERGDEGHVCCDGVLRTGTRREVKERNKDGAWTAKGGEEERRTAPAGSRREVIVAQERKTVTLGLQNQANRTICSHRSERAFAHS